MKTCVCKILTKKGINGTGFFCNIPYYNHKQSLHHIFALVTNNHILNLNDIENDRIITVTLNDDNSKKSIKVDNSRILFTNETLDITFIEIKPDKDKIKHFLEISEEMINKDKNILESKYRKKSIYILHYPIGKKIKVSYGLTNDIRSNNINHFCNTEKGSSGSSVLSLDTLKVIIFIMVHLKIFN